MNHAIAKALKNVIEHGAATDGCVISLDGGRRVAIVVGNSQYLRAPPLFAQERIAIARAHPKRQQEFTLGRHCARDAMSRLAIKPGAIARGNSREPLWPEGVQGSISHCESLAAAAVTRGVDCRVGIDIERLTVPHREIDWGLIVDQDEASNLAQIDHGLMLAFSAKECFYKFIFNDVRRFIDFLEVSIETFDNGAAFQIRAKPPLAASLHGRSTFKGAAITCGEYRLCYMLE